MLIEFSVQNYRSIRDRVSLNMTCVYKKSSNDSYVQEKNLPGLGNVGILSCAAIYGANASGKTNIIRALTLASDLVLKSATELKPDDEIDVEPFRLDAQSSFVPTEFEFTFLIDGIRYQFGFAARRSGVEGEWLFAFPKGRARLVYERYLDNSTEEYSIKIGDRYRIDSELESRVRSNALFLSVAAQFNDRTLMPVYQWFSKRLATLNLSGQGMGLPYTFTAQRLLENPKSRERIVRLLRNADIGIEDVKVEEQIIDWDGLPTELKEHLQADVKTHDDISFSTTRVQFVHRRVESDNTVVFDLQEESAGTQRLFSLLGPIFDMLDAGMCVAIDEIDTSLHPLLTRKLIELVQDEVENKSGAQLIFTTHDTALLNASLLRRDQFWLTEKDSNGATQFYRLSDYRPRPSEALQRGYLAGRYGAIPYFTGELAK